MRAVFASVRAAEAVTCEAPRRSSRPCIFTTATASPFITLEPAHGTIAVLVRL